jgi:uncharacterized iron-regulated membrane protein
MAWIHTWLGLLAGWILFAMFLTGTASYFRPEITRWMQPELRSVPFSQVRAAESAVAYLQSTTPNDEQWYIYLPDGRTTETRVFGRARPDPDRDAPPAPRRPEIKLDPGSGHPVAARETRGGEVFYRFHFQLQLPYPWGRWLAGLCAMFMLGAIISGVVTHKRIFADFFTMRWGKGQRSWLDAHNVSAVLALPYHAMITYTGLVTLIFMYMPWPILANYQKTSDFTVEAYGREREDEPVGRHVPLAPIGPMVAQALGDWGGGRAGTIVIRNPNDAAATVTIERSPSDGLNARSASVTYSGATGRQLSASSPAGPALNTAGVMLGLHLGHFAGPVLRWTCFLLGLTGSAMVGTGLLLWTAKRARTNDRPFLGLRLVQRLNVGTLACLPAGMAALLLANRLLPADLEVAVMFWTWFGMAAMACFRPIARAWPEALSVSAAAFLAIPWVNMAMTDRGTAASLASGDGLYVAFDLATTAIGALLGVAAWCAARARRGITCPRNERLVSVVRDMVDATLRLQRFPLSHSFRRRIAPPLRFRSPLPLASSCRSGSDS